MELVEKLMPYKDVKGKWRRCGKFKCSFCLQIIIRRLDAGKRDKSCGCKKGELTGKGRKGKKREPFTEKWKQNISKGLMGKIPWNKGISLSKEHIQKLKDSHTGKTGELASNWQDGKSFEIYPKEFNKELKQQILERDNYTCQYPGCTEIHDRLHVHHIDYDKKNSNPENLVILGTSCHTKTNGKNRQYWTEFYQNIMMNRIINCLL